MAGGKNRENRSRRWWAGGAAVAGIAVGVAVLWVHIPAWYASTPPEHVRASAVALTRTGVLIAGVVLLVLAGVAAIRTYTRKLAEQLAGRYTAAVTQLGSDTLDIRLGGIYGLERIAVDSAAYHRTVVEVFSAFVRERTTPDRLGAGRRSADLSSSRPPRPDTDVQAILTILGHLPFRVGVPRPDLTGAHLAGAELSGAYLSGAQLSEANLTGAQLANARLIGTNFTRAQMERANLTCASLDSANLTGAQLREANLMGAQLAQANLSRAQQLTQTQLNAAKGDGRTVLPARLTRPARWPDTWPPPSDLDRPLRALACKFAACRTRTGACHTRRIGVTRPKRSPA